MHGVCQTIHAAGHLAIAGKYHERSSPGIRLQGSARIRLTPCLCSPSVAAQYRRKNQQEKVPLLLFL